jgi:hypothetical protein
MYYLFHETPSYSMISPYRTTQNGRGAYEAIVAHHLGTHIQGRVKMEAERTLTTTFYDGQKRSFTFDKFVEKHRSAHQDLAEYGEPVSEDRKVRCFLTGVTAPALLTVKNSVNANPQLLDNFDRCVNYFLQCNATNAATASHGRQVAAMSSPKKSGGRGAGRGSAGGRNERGAGRDNKSRSGTRHANYVAPEVYRKMSPEAREKLRNERDKKPAYKISAAKRAREEEESDDESNSSVPMKEPAKAKKGKAGESMSQRKSRWDS